MVSKSVDPLTGDRGFESLQRRIMSLGDRHGEVAVSRRRLRPEKGPFLELDDALGLSVSRGYA
jgi:hypothetical protein